MFDFDIIITGLVIFSARIIEVAVGTIRTIVTIQGRSVIAFFLSIIRITIWLAVIGTVINQFHDKPLLVVFYAVGTATGNVVGIMVERKLAFGLIILKIITRNEGRSMTDALRKKGQPVTVFCGEGMTGPVNELYVACRRKDLKWILSEVQNIDREAFYVIEQARDMSKVLRPVHTPLGGWRSGSARK